MTYELQKSLEDIVNVYHDYCVQNPQDDYLQPEEFRLLLKENAQKFLRDTLPSDMTEDEYIDDLFEQADKNKNGYLTFPDFVTTLGLLAIYVHDNSHFVVPERGGLVHGHGHSH